MAVRPSLVAGKFNGKGGIIPMKCYFNVIENILDFKHVFRILEYINLQLLSFFCRLHFIAEDGIIGLIIKISTWNWHIIYLTFHHDEVPLH